MNKQLVKNNKQAFEHWLSDGNLLVKLPNSNEWIKPNPEFWNYSGDVNIVIDDEYIELRKALAEDKIVQYQYYNDKIHDTKEWFDLPKDEGFIRLLNRYRIKPDEPKFKVGDWVKHVNGAIGVVHKVFKNPIANKRDIEVRWKLDSKNQLIIDDGLGEHNSINLNFWKPKPGEVVWAYDKSFSLPILVRFEETDEDGIHCVENHLSEQIWLTYIQPLTSELPEEFKNA